MAAEVEAEVQLAPAQPRSGPGGGRACRWGTSRRQAPQLGAGALYPLPESESTTYIHIVK